MKRSFSLFAVLAGLLLLAFIILSTSLLAFDYRNARLAVEREIDRTFSHNKALLQLVFDAHLDELSAQLSSQVHQLFLTSGAGQTGAGLQDYQRALRQIRLQGETSRFDLMVLASTDGRECMDVSPLNQAVKGSCQQLIQQFDDELYAWHLFVLDQSSALPAVGMITREPLVDSSTGYIHGYLYGGMLLTRNLALVNQARSAGPRNIMAVGLAFEDQLLVATARQDSPEYAALVRVLEQDKPNDYALGQFFGQASDLFLVHEPPDRLQFLTLTDTEALTRLEQELIRNSLVALAVSTVLAAALALIGLRFTIAPFRRLLNFARQERTAASSPLHQGWIREFNQLSLSVAEILTDLAREKSLSDQAGADLARTNARLQDTNDRNKALLHRILNLQEEERKYLAQELHDELGQTLTVVRTDAYLIRNLVPEDNPAWESARSICENAQEMYDIVYNRIINLRPLSLNDLGLADAIRSMPALKSTASQDIRIELDLDGWSEPVAEAVEINLYRIAQEALTNVLKHSGASRAWIKLERDNRRVRLEVGDNGCGFDMLDRQIWERFGISGMQERAEAIGGTLEINQDGGNTRVQVELMLAEEHLL